MTSTLIESELEHTQDEIENPKPVRASKPLVGPPCFTAEGVRLRYTPIAPHAKQNAFLATTCKELFFGGSGGGGKSWALLAAALQFVDVPGYNALILRRKLTDLTIPGALISMSHDWLDGTDAKYNANERKWTFPSGAVLQFGYLDHPQDAGRYRGSEFHFIGWDELGEIPLLESYTFLFSRLRRPKGLSREQIVEMYGEAPDGTTLLDIPLRVRGASNPGGPGSEWVRDRFIEGPVWFIPSSYRDNPAIDDEEYEESLAELSEIERRRMGDGDWSVQEIPGALWAMADIARDPWTAPYVVETEEGEPDFVKQRPWNLVSDGVERFDRVIMAVDPTVGEGAGDECGIVIGGQEEGGRLVVLADLSEKMHPDVWSSKCVINYHLYGCTVLVMEDNNGRLLNRTQINSAADKLGVERPKVHLRNAEGSKEARAAVARQAYTTTDDATLPMVVHHSDLRGSGLENQMVGWVPGASKAESGVKSPDRVDAVSWLVREALYPDQVPARKVSNTKRKLSQW